MASDRISVGARTVQAGEFTIGPVQIAAARQRFVASLDATQHLNPGVRLGIIFETSHDGGDTWDHNASSSRRGGVVFNDDGEAENTITFALDIPPERNGVRRRVRCRVLLEGGSLVTAGGFIEAID